MKCLNLSQSFSILTSGESDTMFFFQMFGLCQGHIINIAYPFFSERSDSGFPLLNYSPGQLLLSSFFCFNHHILNHSAVLHITFLE